MIFDVLEIFLPQWEKKKIADDFDDDVDVEEENDEEFDGDDDHEIAQNTYFAQNINGEYQYFYQSFERYQYILTRKKIFLIET